MMGASGSSQVIAGQHGPAMATASPPPECPAHKSNPTVSQSKCPKGECPVKNDFTFISECPASINLSADDKIDPANMV